MHFRAHLQFATAMLAVVKGIIILIAVIIDSLKGKRIAFRSLFVRPP